MAPRRLQARFWCLLLVAFTTVHSNVSASYVDLLASVLEYVGAKVNVPSGASVKDDALKGVGVDKSAKTDDVEDCSKDGTCTTGNLYDGFEGGKEKEGDEEYEEDDEEEWGDAEDDEEEEEECFDNHEKCDEWALMGKCEANARYMLQNCKKACMTCVDVYVFCKVFLASSCFQVTDISSSFDFLQRD
jgi:hypothetical protein